MHAQAARKIDQAAHAGEAARAERNCRQAAIGLAGDDNTLLVDPALRSKIRQRCLQVIGLSLRILGHVATRFEILSAGIRKALAHRNRDGITTPNEFTTNDEKAITRLPLRITERLAMIHHQQGKRPATGGFENRRFKLHASDAGRGRNHHDLLIERLVQARGTGDARTQRGEQEKQEHAACKQ